MVFVFDSVYVMDYIYGFAYVEPALPPRDEAYLIMMDKLLDVLLPSVCQYFIEDFWANNQNLQTTKTDIQEKNNPIQKWQRI